MTNNESYENMDPFQNPDLLPLDNLKLEIKTDGVVQKVDALNRIWASDRYFLHYEAPNIYDKDGVEIVGSKERWMEIVSCMIDDTRWLLGLPFYRFWSNVVFNPSIVNSLVSFLQEAPPFYALENFPNCPEMLDLLTELSRYVLVVFTRLVTNKESPSEYMTQRYLGNLLYDNYIYTIPIVFDLCQLYGRENNKVVTKILNCVFASEPRYHNDLQQTVPHLVEALENIDVTFVCGAMLDRNKEVVPLPQRRDNSVKLTLFNLEDMILYLLDVTSTVTVFLKCYCQGVFIFHKDEFLTKIMSTYGNTIPEMYKALANLANNYEQMPKYIELKHRLDVTRVEILNIFRIVTFEPILTLSTDPTIANGIQIRERVEEYLNFLTNAISEKEFLTDYNRLYAVTSDIEMLKDICPNIDMAKCDYILQAVEPNINSGTSNNKIPDSVNVDIVGHTSGYSDQARISEGASSSTENDTLMKDDSLNLFLLVSKVKDILDELDEQFIKVALVHYNYEVETLINAVLEDTLPSELNKLKNNASSQGESSQPDYQVTVNDTDITYELDALKLQDKYENVSINTQKDIEVPKDYILRNYSLVDEYDDEFDDTYENRKVRGIMQDETIEMYSRPFGTPRVLEKHEETVDQYESEEEDVQVEQNGEDCFIENPADVRMRAEQRRQAMRGRGRPSNVIGNPKGRGQEQSVQYDRQKKNAQKAKRGNHNRRAGSTYKRNQGLIPS